MKSYKSRGDILLSVSDELNSLYKLGIFPQIVVDEPTDFIGENNTEDEILDQNLT